MIKSTCLALVTTIVITTPVKASTIKLVENNVYVCAEQDWQIRLLDTAAPTGRILKKGECMKVVATILGKREGYHWAQVRGISGKDWLLKINDKEKNSLDYVLESGC